MFIPTVDTDVIVILAGINFEGYTLTWICGWHLAWAKAFSTFKALVKKSVWAYHFTTHLQASQFLGKGKKKSWGARKAYSSATTAFQYAVYNPFQILDDNFSNT